jgi:hypothetical protein
MTSHPLGETVRRPIAMLGAILTLALCGLAFAASSAHATRIFETHFGQLVRPTSVAIDAQGDAWISDFGRPPHPSEDGLYKYSPYPSPTLLVTPNTEQAWGGSLSIQVAVDQATGEVFAASQNPRTVAIFNENGEYTHSWTGINGHTGCITFDCVPYMRVAIDNTHTYSGGRVYLSLAGPENDVEVFDNGRRPVDFPATASYISANKLLGTPSGPFGSVAQLAVDAEGNLFVSDVVEGVIDEFDSTGTFVRAFPGPGGGNAYEKPGLAVDPTNGNVVIGDGSEYDAGGNFLGYLEPNDVGGSPSGAPGFNADGYLYMPSNSFGGGQDVVGIYGPTLPVPSVEYHRVASQTATSGTVSATVGPNGGTDVTYCRVDYGTGEAYGSTVPCTPDPGAASFSAPTEITAPLAGLTSETTYHYRVVAESGGGKKYGADQTYTPHGVVGLTTEGASGVTESSATLNGSLLGTGTPLHYYFEWGPTTAYGNTSAAPPGAAGGSPSGPGRTQLQFDATGLTPYSTYHYRIVATDGSGTSHGEDRMFTTLPGIPDAAGVTVTAVHSDRSLMHAEINANGALTDFHFEYVDDASFQSTGWAGARIVTPAEPIVGMGKHLRVVSALAPGLQQGTSYHYRVVATNFAGSGTAEGTFRTFPFLPFNDPCPNAHVRQQTGAAQLLDCRAYELASAADAGGYDVESNLEGGTPFAGYPRAEGPSQVLYGVHSGAIAGTGEPTNHGIDPYVATRGSDGWTTKYVGIPADGTPSTEAFGSALLEADSSLDTFAFGGSICSPCFGDGSTGIPVHTPGGALVQGMKGSIAQPGAVPAGYVGHSLSADGRHLVFGSTSQFEPDGNSNGDVSIYDRDLTAGVTHVVSKTPGGATMTGPGIGELDVSADGSRIVIGQQVSSDSAGNRYWRLYMNIGDSGDTVDLTPGATHGALYDGMTADGTHAFFTTSDPLTGDDTDSSADVYEVDLTNPGAPKLTRISSGSGGVGNSDSCDPVANSRRPHWNSVEGTNCDAVAIAGGGGVAATSGSIYFLSPELLDGASNGVQDAPNLYVSEPGGTPRFVATLESSANAPLPLAEHPFQRYFGSFEKPGGAAIDPVNGDVYVLDISGSTGGAVQKFDSTGHAVTSFGDHGKLTGANTPAETIIEYGLIGLPTQIAVDDDPASPSYRDIYIPDFLNGVVDKFDRFGNYISQLQAGSVSAVAVDPGTGRVYVGRFEQSTIRVYGPTGVELSEFEVFDRPTGIAVDPGTGRVYVADGGGPLQVPGRTEIYDFSGKRIKLFTGRTSKAVSVDPTTGHVYVDEALQVSEFDSSGAQVGNPIGAGKLSESFSLGSYGGVLAVANPHGGNVALFGAPEVPENNLTDNPLVVDSLRSAATRMTADFQVTPSGSYAAFPSALSLTGYDNGGHREVFRYGSATDALECASCNSTGEQATGESSLASNGLSLTDDGRVFFDAEEGLVDRDLNEKRDAYEWERQPGESEGKAELISSGTSILPASLLGASADGVDAYFFTHETLASGDLNGGRVKIYDARENGGFPFVPQPIPCQASDECHGAGSQAPSPATIPSTAGTPAPSSASTPRGKKHRRHRHKHRHKHRHRKSKHRGGHRNG